MTNEPRPALPGAALAIVTTQQVIDRLVELLRTGLFGRTLGEAAERVLCRGLEDALISVGAVEGPKARPYRCRMCQHQWLAAFESAPDPTTEYAVQCPSCGHLAGEPFTAEED